MPEKFLEYLSEAEKIIKTVDHMTYMTYPIVQDKKMLIKIVLEIKNALAKCINSILQYEYIYKTISLSPNPKTNFETFKSKSAPRYQITPEEISVVLELFDIAERHKQSPMEFVKDEKVIILSEELEPKEITLEKTKEFITAAKNILRKTREKMVKN